MKTLTGVIALMLALMFGASSVVVAAEKAKPAPATPAQERTGSKPPAGEKLMTGKVTQVKDGTFTVVAKGKEYTFVFQKIEALPKIGDIIDVTYTETPSGAKKVTTINTSKSNTF